MGLPGPPWLEGQQVRVLGLGSECEKDVAEMLPGPLGPPQGRNSVTTRESDRLWGDPWVV